MREQSGVDFRGVFYVEYADEGSALSEPCEVPGRNPPVESLGRKEYVLVGLHQRTTS